MIEYVWKKNSHAENWKGMKWILCKTNVSSLTLCCRCGSCGLICLSLFIFSRAEIRTVLWIRALVDRPLLFLLRCLLRRRRAAAGFRGRRRGGGRGGWDAAAGRWRCDGPIGLAAGALGRQVDVSVELGGFWLGVRGDWGVLPVTLSFQLLCFLQLRGGSGWVNTHT